MIFCKISVLFNIYQTYGPKNVNLGNLIHFVVIKDGK